LAVVEYERRDHVAIIRMNRPERLNAMGHELMMGLAQAWNRYKDDGEAWIAILTGVGRAFCAGMDIKERLESGKPGLGLPKLPLRDPYWEHELDKPTIAAVNGYALGGGFFLTSWADLRVASENAVFQITEVARSGLAGYDTGLWENLPYAIAAELAAGIKMSARRAYEVGFVNRLVPEGQALEAALGLAHSLLESPPLAVHHNLRLLRSIRHARATPPPEIPAQAKKTNQELASTQDLQESLRSFVEKRKPHYQRG